MSKLNQKLIQQLRDGEIAVLNNGNTEQLKTVLTAAFPDNHEYEDYDLYFKHQSFGDTWNCAKGFNMRNNRHIKKAVGILNFFEPEPEQDKGVIIENEEQLKKYFVDNGFLKEKDVIDFDSIKVGDKIWVEVGVEAIVTDEKKERSLYFFPVNKSTIPFLIQKDKIKKHIPQPEIKIDTAKIKLELVEEVKNSRAAVATTGTPEQIYSIFYTAFPDLIDEFNRAYKNRGKGLYYFHREDKFIGHENYYKEHRVLSNGYKIIRAEDFFEKPEIIEIDGIKYNKAEVVKSIYITNLSAVE